MSGWKLTRDELPHPCEDVLITYIHMPSAPLSVEMAYMNKRGDWLLAGDIDGQPLDEVIAWRPLPNAYDPFFHGTEYGAVDGASRLSELKDFDLHQCYIALHMEHLQKSVRAAVARRYKKLKAEQEANNEDAE